VDFSTADDELQRLLSLIDSYPETSACRHELEATVFGHMQTRALQRAAHIHMTTNHEKEEPHG
jgi:hypothetical protein